MKTHIKKSLILENQHFTINNLLSLLGQREQFLSVAVSIMVTAQV